jgi:hypothetical protein
MQLKTLPMLPAGYRWEKVANEYAIYDPYGYVVLTSTNPTLDATVICEFYDLGFNRGQRNAQLHPAFDD